MGEVQGGEAMSACLVCGSECIDRSIREHEALDYLVTVAIEASHGYGNMDWRTVREALRRAELLKWWNDVCDDYA
jgi:hypothetical protein